jgi:thiamine-monophosphate kinase
MAGEFDLIARHFAVRAAAGAAAPRVALGIGDDCALLEGGADWQWAVSTDMLLEGVHFLPDVDPASLGHKALAVNLSDLAACGATPRACLLSIGLPRDDEDWLAAFARGFFALADAYGCRLAGGDTTRSPAGVVINVSAFGEVPHGAALRRDGARPGDELWVSGQLGDGALGLLARRGAPAAAHAAAAILRLERPEPRVALGAALRGVATSAIDVSDGLAGDLGHVLAASRAGARIDWPAVPRSAALRACADDLQQRCVLAGGDDYELLFTAPAAQHGRVLAAGASAGVAVTRIGEVTAAPGLRLVESDGRTVDIAARAFDHFAR